jgi:hypothetical protein
MHPGNNNDALKLYSNWNVNWQSEFTALTDAGFKEMIPATDFR